MMSMMLFSQEEREATIEECERAGTKEGRNGVSNLDGKPNEERNERNESSLSPGKMKNTFHAVINIVDSGEG